MELFICTFLLILGAILFVFLYINGIKKFFGRITKDNNKCDNCIYYKYYIEHNKKDS